MTENRSLKRFKWVIRFSFKLCCWKHECSLEKFCYFFLLLFFEECLHSYTEMLEDVGSRMDEWELTKVRTQGMKKKKRGYCISYVLVLKCRFWVFRPFQVCSQTNKKDIGFFVWCKRTQYWNGVAFAFFKDSTKQY